MKQKSTYKLIGVILIVVALVLFFAFGFTAPPEDASRAQINQQSEEDVSSESTTEETINLGGTEETEEKTMISQENSFFEFEGYGPGKSHIGTFDEFEVSFSVSDGVITGVEGTIQADSVNTGIGGLDNHLKNDDFFDVTVYPEITFTSSQVDATSGEITGMLDFHGVEHEVTFPATITDTTITADFVLDTTPFNIKYTGVNKEVRIAFEFSV